ncbi:Vacuolar protein sorting-associated protein 16 [Polyrhizophydium stewartii]|uniref:Probable vacuolar protein sorting-associated protein 16 homolog n=1 Tax=Polyrhizophydium stewartii TaxID=2732419 RepID=A0ABR4NH86_9FUNG
MSLSFVSPCGDWNPLADKFYRKHDVYHMMWTKMDLSRLTVAAAPFGGPIAAMRNDRKMIAAPTAKPVMHIFTSSGKLLSQFQWDKGRIVAMGWTRSERLVCVMEYGLLRLYDLHGDFVQITLGDEAKDSGVLDALVHDNSVVVLTNALKLIAVANIDEPRPVALADPQLTQQPHSWAVVPPSQSLSKHVEVLLAVGNTIVVVDTKNAQDQLLQQGPFARMSLSPNAKFLALFTADGRLWVVSSDFQNNLAEFRTNSTVPPLQMTWCGNDSVLLHWEDTILMVGPSGDWIKYAYEGVVHIVNEIDCARIISNRRCELLERVPSVTEGIFKIGSTAPGAILFDAREHFEKESPKADENVRSIRSQLMDAVISCIDAAGNEFDVQLQKALLRAASFGKAFLESFSAERFVDMCRSVRVLNAVRDPEIGIPITYKQFMHISPEGLVDRLIQRREHLLARRICEFLKMPIDRVMIDWASTKVKQSSEDEETVCRQVVSKLSDCTNISYAEVAKAAYAAGRVKLATKLLDFEPSPANQVPLLLSMEQDELALVKAVESYDADLVYLVLLHMKRKMPSAMFFSTVSGKPLACSLLEIYCREQDPQLLRNFFYQEDRRIASANLIFEESQREPDLQARQMQLKGAIKLYGEEKESVFEQKSMEDHSKLLSMQATYEREIPGQVFMNLSVTETIQKLLVLGHSSRASKLKGDMFVDNKRYAWLELAAIIQTENWDQLDKFRQPASSGYSMLGAATGAGGGGGSSGAAKIGPKSVVDALVEAGHVFRAQLFVESLAKSVSAVALSEIKAHLANLQAQVPGASQQLQQQQQQIQPHPRNAGSTPADTSPRR